jgi:hypothetical protein
MSSTCLCCCHALQSIMTQCHKRMLRPNGALQSIMTQCHKRMLRPNGQLKISIIRYNWQKKEQLKPHTRYNNYCRVLSMSHINPLLIQRVHARLGQIRHGIPLRRVHVYMRRFIRPKQQSARQPTAAMTSYGGPDEAHDK